MTTEIHFLEISSSSDLILHEACIRELFARSFGTELDSDVWKWAYINNPSGAPAVSLAFDGDRLVGHYAVIPFPFLKEGTTLSSYLSMTTMVDKDYRRLGLFVRQAEQVYSIVKNKLGGDCVLGFPNQNSLPGFRKRLNWIIEQDHHVVSVKGKDVNKISDHLSDFNFSSGYGQLNSKVMEWRKNKPGSNWQWDSEVAVKEFNGHHDVMYFDDHENLAVLADLDAVSILVPGDEESLKEKGFDVEFCYPFGFRNLRGADDIPFGLRMAHSDVF